VTNGRRVLVSVTGQCLHSTPEPWWRVLVAKIGQPKQEAITIIIIITTPRYQVP